MRSSREGNRSFRLTSKENSGNSTGISINRKGALSTIAMVLTTKAKGANIDFMIPTDPSDFQEEAQKLRKEATQRWKLHGYQRSEGTSMGSDHNDPRNCRKSFRGKVRCATSPEVGLVGVFYLDAPSVEDDLS
jgi:hypothetical protein